jgi:hypothetical protein
MDGDNYCAKCGVELSATGKAAGSTTEVPLFYQRRASYHPKESTRITGEFHITTKRISFKPHLFMNPFEITYLEIGAITQAYTIFLNTYFTVRLKNGREYMFSLNSVDISKTQSVVNLIRGYMKG